MSKKIRILIADDQQLVREGLRLLLDLTPDIEVAAEVKNGLEALDQVGKIKPDVILMDVQMPEMDGITAARKIHKDHPRIGIIILTTFDDDEYVFEGLLAGAAGYLLKDVPSEQLAQAIRAAAKGEMFIHPSVTGKVVSRLTRLTERERARHEQPLEAPLTNRELEVLALMAQGFNNQQVMERLCIASGTVKNHIGSIYAKLGVHDRTQAVLQAKELGLI
jgi:DNA-binding NarL/FixJ family response regulator